MTNRHAYTLSSAIGALAGLALVLAVMVTNKRAAVGEMLPAPEEATVLPMVEQSPELIAPSVEAENAEVAGTASVASTNKRVASKRTASKRVTKKRVAKKRVATKRVAGSGPSTTATGSTLEGIPDQPSRAAIARSIITIRSRIHHCGERHPGSGTVRVKVRLSTWGHVIDADALTEHNALGHCVAEAMRHARFPRSREGVTFTYSFAFSGKR